MILTPNEEMTFPVISETKTYDDRIMQAAFILCSLGRMTPKEAKDVIRGAINVSLYGDTPMVVDKKLLDRAIEVAKR